MVTHGSEGSGVCLIQPLDPLGIPLPRKRVKHPPRKRGNPNTINKLKTILSWLTRLQSNQIAPVIVSATGGTVTREQALRHVYVSNLGASGATTFALPAAEPGLRVTAVVEVAQMLRLDPNLTETIALPSTGVQGAAGKYLEANALAETVELVCLSKGTWDVVNFQGTWTAEA